LGESGGQGSGPRGRRSERHLLPRDLARREIDRGFARDGEVNDRDVWFHDVAVGSKRVHAPAKGNDNFPIWSPDGKQIVWTSSRTGEYELYKQDSLLLKQPASQYPRSILPGGKWLHTQADKKRDLYLLNLEGEPKPKPVFPGAPYWTDAGRYFAFVSNEAGPFEVYIARRGSRKTVEGLSRELSNGWGRGGSGRDGAPTGRSSSTRWETRWWRKRSSRRAVQVRDCEAAVCSGRGWMGNFPDEAPWRAKYDVVADGQKFVFFMRVIRRRIAVRSRRAKNLRIFSG
jgi:hypothetical protein